MIEQLNYILLPLALLACAIFIPGMGISYILDREAGVAKHLAVAPAFSFGIVTLGTLVTKYLPFEWGYPAFALLSTSVITLILAIKTLVKVAKKSHTATNEVGTERVFIPAKALLITVAIWLVSIFAVITRVDFNRVIQGGDSNYHYNQLVLISQTGDIHPLTANAGMGGLDQASWFYPTTWHAFITLGTSSGATIINSVAAFLLLMPLVWLVGISALTTNTLRNNKAWVWAAITALIVPIATIRLELNTTLWPFYTALVVVPGLLAFVLEKQPKNSFAHAKLSFTDFFKNYLWRSICAVIALLGLCGLHPSVILVPGVGVVATFVVALIQRGISFYHRKQFKVSLLNGGFALALFALFVIVIYAPGPHQTQLHRYPDVGWGNWYAKIPVGTGAFLPAPYYTGIVLMLLVIALLMLGSLTLIRSERFLLLAAAFSQWLILMGTYFPLPVFSKITSFYYNVPDRAKLAYAIFLIPILVVAFERTLQFIAKCIRLNHLILAGGLAFFFGACIYPGVRMDIDNAFYPEPGSVRFLADDNELAMIKRTAQTLSDTDLVIGDPAAGASLIYTLSGRDTVWKYPAVTQDKEDDWYLVRNFYNYKKDPHVCELVQKYKITHFYKDISSFFNGSYTWKLRPGMYAVDTNNPGFQLIDSGSTAQLFKITYCDNK